MIYAKDNYASILHDTKAMAYKIQHTKGNTKAIFTRKEDYSSLENTCA